MVDPSNKTLADVLEVLRPITPRARDVAVERRAEEIRHRAIDVVAVGVIRHLWRLEVQLRRRDDLPKVERSSGMAAGEPMAVSSRRAPSGGG